ncbi:MAG: serine/threonine protein kinase [Planctomycetes bacterium]|nr:serine/threonine protein kinase [Planctomycetota bacterium]
MADASDSGLHLKPLPRIGQELGRFLVEKELPRGGQARVYRAWQTDLQRPVALKLLPATFASDQDAVARFSREIENVARVSHPNVVRVYEAGQMEGHPFFTMEFIEGDDAETMIKAGPLGPDQAAGIMEAVARGVAQAHAEGIVHRDIKPGNIIVRRDGTPVLTDFGLAQDLSQSAQLTRTGVSMGTPAYMSPEQARGQRERVGKKSDVYSLGATLFTLLTAKRPVEGESAYELMLHVAESESPKWPRQALEDVPQDLRAIVEMAMQNDSARRYESAIALAEDLERYLRGEWVVARSRSRLARAWVRVRRYVPAAAVVVLASAVAAGMVYSGLDPQPADNGAGRLLDTKDLSGAVGKANEEDLARLFGGEGSWTKSGADVRRGTGDAMVLERVGAGPIAISPREPACWGDFTLQTQFRVDDPDGELDLLVGMPEDGGLADSAYAIRLGCRARDRFAMLRLGVEVYGGYRAAEQPIVESGRWYAAIITRAAQRLAFTVTDLATGQPVAGFSYQDDFPALLANPGEARVAERQRYGIVARGRTLAVRAVTVAHRDDTLGTETLLFSVGQYAEAELRLSARLQAGLAPDADAAARSERAELVLLRALCRERLGRAQEALADCTDLKLLVTAPEDRARAFLVSARLESALGRDESALAHLRVARINAGTLLLPRVFYEARARARALQEQEPRRALGYLDFVATEALGTPWLVADALVQSAGLRLSMAEGAALPDATALRGEALAALRRLESAGYRRFADSYLPAMGLLSSHVWDNLLLAEPGEQQALVNELGRIADGVAGALGGYQVRSELLVAPLSRAAWAMRLWGREQDEALTARSAGWLAAASQAANGTPQAFWVALLQALHAEERPRGAGLQTRLDGWRALAAQLKTDEPEHAVAADLCDFFLGTPLDAQDARRRHEMLRRNLRRDLRAQDREWLAGASADALADYCAALFALFTDREQAGRLLESASARPDAGMLRLLAGRAGVWLPPG